MTFKTFPLLLLASGLLVASCVVSKPRVKAPTTQQLGYVLPYYNFSIDAEHNERATDIIPGYTVVTVAIANKSLKPLRMRPDKDRWEVKERRGKWHKAINEIRYREHGIWGKLDPRVQQLMSYPLTVPPGYTQTFEIFLKGRVDMDDFLAIRHRNTYLKKTFTFTRYE